MKKKILLSLISMSLMGAILAPSIASANTIDIDNNVQSGLTILNDTYTLTENEDYMIAFNPLNRLVNGVQFTGWFVMMAPAVNNRWHVLFLNGKRYQGWIYQTGNKQLVSINGNGQFTFRYQYSGLLNQK